MGIYTTRAVSKREAKEILDTIRTGYLDHKPNPQVATILVLESNLGCRIGDILNLKTDSFYNDGGIWKLNIVEQKTGKKRNYIVPQPVIEFINRWIEYRGILRGDKLFSIKSGAVHKALRNVIDYLGLENVSTHSFRKAAANRLYENTGHDIEAVRSFLQHSDTKITMAYIRRSSEQMENAITASCEIL